MNTIAEQQIMSRNESNWLLFWTFLKIGSTAFGGFMALIVVVQNYVVDRKKLLSDAEKYISAALVGIRSSVVGMIAAAALVIIQTAEQNYISLGIFSVSLLLLIRFKLEVAWIIPAAGLFGFLLY